MAEDVGVFGAGYVGLVTGVCLAHSGHRVTLYDIEKERLAALAAGRSPIFEPRMEEFLADGIAAGRLRFEPVDGVEALPETVFVAVGTPMTATGAADLCFVRTVVERIEALARPGTVVVMKSTVPPGTGSRLAERLHRAGCHYASNPEFLREGSAIDDWYRTDRVVVGGDAEATARLRELYVDIDAEIVECDVTSAEMIKYASNAFLATKISFINEIATLCDHVGADIDAVSHGVGLDKRIGAAFLRAGIGYGGSCFPKDTRALDFLATVNGYDFHLLRAVIEVNTRQRVLPVRMLRDRLAGLEGRRVAVLGLTFKPNTDDCREAPAGDIIRMLAAEGAEVVGFNPIPVEASYEGATVAETLAEALLGAEAAIVTTEWPEIVGADWEAAAQGMTGARVVYDGRNCLDAACVRAAGCDYIGIGRAI